MRILLIEHGCSGLECACHWARVPLEIGRGCPERPGKQLLTRPSSRRRHSYHNLLLLLGMVVRLCSDCQVGWQRTGPGGQVLLLLLGMRIASQTRNIRGNIAFIRAHLKESRKKM